MKNIFPYILVLFSFQILFGLSLHEANLKIPEIVNDPPALINVVFELDKTNRVTFLKTVEKSVTSYPGDSNTIERLKKDIHYFAFCATNNNPQTVMQIEWNKQLDVQHRIQLLGVDANSKFENMDVNADGSVSVTTQPLFNRPHRFEIIKEVSGYPGQ